MSTSWQSSRVMSTSSQPHRRRSRLGCSARGRHIPYRKRIFLVARGMRNGCTHRVLMQSELYVSDAVITLRGPLGRPLEAKPSAAERNPGVTVPGCIVQKVLTQTRSTKDKQWRLELINNGG